jgi:hypothetical protein
MSYLDELKKQAADVKAKEEEEKARQALLAKNFDTIVKPGLKKLHLYLRDVAEQLNFIKPETYVDYTLEHFGTIQHLAQGDYLVGDYDNAKNTFFMRFTCKAKKKLTFTCKSQMLIKVLSDYLWEHNIRFDYVQKNDANHQFMRGVFQLSGEIIGEFRFTADYENSAIAVQARNFDRIGKRYFVLKPEDLDDAFMDQIGRYIARSIAKPEIIEQFAVSDKWWMRGKNPLAERERQEKLEKLKQSLRDDNDTEQTEAQRKRLEALRQQALEEELRKAREARNASRDSSLKDEAEELGKKLKSFFTQDIFPRKKREEE